MEKRWHYVYIILYPSLGYKFYYGSRVTDIHPEEDTSYFGSLVTFAHYNDPNHAEYQADAIKVVLRAVYAVSSPRVQRQMWRLESRLIKEALRSSHVGPELCVNRNIAGRIYCTKEERKKWGAKGGGKNSSLLRERLSKTFKFTDPAGKPRDVFGLRTFCRNNNLDPAAMRRVSQGKSQTHKGWRKYVG